MEKQKKKEMIVERIGLQRLKKPFMDGKANSDEW
jgi:hypothetical protein